MITYTVEDWIKDTLNSSNKRWVISVFKIRGSIVDNSGQSRNIVNELSIPKFIKAMDWTITTGRRRFKSKNMKFIPFYGGGKSIQKSFHIHAFIEIPDLIKYSDFSDNLKLYFNQFASRAYKIKVESNLWMERLHKPLIANHTHYCTRFEDGTYFKGSEKVLFECQSCLL